MTFHSGSTHDSGPALNTNMMGGYPAPPPAYQAKLNYPEAAGPPMQYYDQYGNPVQFPVVYAVPQGPPAMQPQPSKPAGPGRAEGCLAG